MKKGGEFFTPTSIVKLIVDVIEPYETVNILFRAASEKRGVLKEHFTQLTNLLLRWAHAIWKYYREQYREKKSFDVNKWLEKEKGCFRLDALIRSGCQ